MIQCEFRSQFSETHFVKSKHIERVQNIKLTDEQVKQKKKKDKLLYILGVLILIMILAVVLTR